MYESKIAERADRELGRAHIGDISAMVPLKRLCETSGCVFVAKTGQLPKLMHYINIPTAPQTQEKVIAHYSP
jgi:hypothetical protein